jgi:CheY-like chemotaxis protein
VAAGEYVMLAMSDNGTGMSQDVQAQIFEPFFTTKEIGKGTGLGLASVYGTVKQSGGFIWVYSEIGKGTTFKLYFPAIDLSGQQVSAPTQAQAHLGGSEKILLVEDEPALLAVSSAFLQSKGYQVLEATNGKEALEVCQKHPDIDVLVTDVVMPDIGGPVLVREATKLLPGVHVIFMSGYTDRGLDDKVLEPGMEFLQKPFSLDLFARTLRKMLDSPKTNP